MIEGISKAGAGRLELVRTGVERAGQPAPVGDAASDGAVAGPASASSAMAAEGAPVDAGKVAAIRDAIAQGRYPVDPDKIAASMVALDLMPKGGA